MGGKITTSLLGVISFGILAHYLKEQQFGEYSLIFSFVGFIAVFADLGLGTLLTREIAAKRADEKYISFVFTLRFLLSIFTTLIGSVLIFLFPYSLNVKIGVCLLAAANIFYLLSSITWAIFQAQLRFEKIVIAQVLSSLIACILIVFSVFLSLPFLFFTLASAIATILGFIITYLLYPGTISLKKNSNAFLNILKEAWPLGAGVIVSVIYFKIDSLILPYYYNPSTHPDLGYYSLAYRIFEVAIVFGGYYAATLFPVFSQLLSSKNFIQLFKKHLIYTSLLGIAASIILFIFARIFILILGGINFAPAITSLQILSFAAFASILSGFFLNIGVAGGKQLLVLKLSAVTAILNILLNLLVIPKYSFIGASWTTVFTQVFILATNIYIALLVMRPKTAPRT